MISDEDKERVRQASDLVQIVGETVTLRQQGGDLWGCCPFHRENTPSFHVRPAAGLWYCFGCHAGGDVFDYIMKRENLEFHDAVRYLADKAGIELHDERTLRRGPKRSRLIDVCEEAQAYFGTTLFRSRESEVASARAYLANRGFNSAVCKRWKLGYACGRDLVDHLRVKGFTAAEIIGANLGVSRSSGGLGDRFFRRVMFPIHDVHGHCIAFGGRIIGDGNPKYLNTSDTPVFQKHKNMYAFDYSKDSIAAQGCAIVVEGYTDAIALYEAGFTNVVATLGTALTADHIALLGRFAQRVILMFDGDRAGQRAAERALQYLDTTTTLLTCVVLADNLDPADYIATHGASKLKDCLTKAQPLLDFVFTTRIDNADLSNPGRRIAVLDELAQLLAPLKRSVLLDEYAARLADAVGVDVNKARERILKARPEKAPAPSDDNVSRQAPAPVSEPVTLSADEISQVCVERALLALIAHDIMQCGESEQARIVSLSWIDDRHRAIAEALLSLAAGTPASERITKARAVCPDVSHILATGDAHLPPDLSSRARFAFLLDTVDLYSTRRKLRELKGRVQMALSPDVQKTLLQQAMDLQKTLNLLTQRLACVEDYEKNG